MALPPLLKRRPPDIADTRPLQGGDPVARARARRRLIGAAVLVLIAVIALPLLFESKPRPRPEATANLSADIGAGPPASKPVQSGHVVSGTIGERASEPASLASPSVAVAEATPPGSPSPAASTAKVDVLPAEKPGERAVPEKSPPKTAEKPAPKPAEKTAEKPASKPEASPPLSPAAPKTARFVVQVGAFADDSSAKEARARVERLGLKTFTQDVEVQGARRIRVRVGPFDSQADADRAVATLKAGKLPGVVIKL
jgi:DedD protein